MTGGPLGDVRIVDLSLLLPGPFCTRLLTDLGAEVVRVEPLRGDRVRDLMPGLYEFLNRGKRGIRVDLKTEAGRELVLRLIARADAVVESFRPGVVDRLGVGFEAALRRNRSIVYASISGFGQTGPRSAQPGHDIGYEAAGGAFGGVIAAGAAVSAPHLPIADLGSAMLAALDITAALREPRASREAVHLDISMQEAVTYLAASRWGAYLATGRPPAVEHLANHSPGHGVVTTRDGVVLAIAAVEDHFWAALCAALGLEELALPPLDRHAARMAARVELAEQVAARVAERDARDVLASLRSHDVPVDEVLSIEQTCADEHMTARGAIVKLASGERRLRHPVRAGERRSWCDDRLPDPTVDLADVLDDLGVEDDLRRDLGGLGAATATSG